jgi:hypothetical protein
MHTRARTALVVLAATIAGPAITARAEPTLRYNYDYVCTRGYALPDVPRNAGGLLRLFAAAWVALAAALVAAFPVMLLLMIWLRNLMRSM